MSSRSFRRRNSRRRRRQGAPGSGSPGTEGAFPAEGVGADSAGSGNGGAQGNRGPGRRPGGRPQGGRQPGGRAQAGRRQSAGPSPGRQPSEAVPEPFRREPAVPIVLPDCPVCGKPVRELVSALTHRVSRQPAHFDCVVRELRESNEVAPQEKICYLGGGSFGILEFRPSGGSPRFVIRKRIQYEEKEAPHDWKKPLQVSC